MQKIKVLIIDDSAVVRQVLTRLLQSDPQIEVIGTAADPYIAASKIAQEVPDVITLDVEMPRMDGLTFLKKIMSQHPVPVVIISSLTAKGTETAIKALEYGAVEVYSKPRIETNENWEHNRERICEIVKTASKVSVNRRNGSLRERIQPKNSADVIMAPSSPGSMIKTTDKVIVVGASTGGTEALKIFLESMPLDSPGILVVQHMPELFTRSFANRLNSICRITVKEAENGDSVINGRALIAPGNKHLCLKRSGARYYVEIKDGPYVNRHRPSVDVLFRSTARYAGRNSVGILLTGMGSDGAKGLLEMKEAGAKTIAQDEKSCVVFGMPKEAIKLNAVDKVLPLDNIAPFVLSSIHLW
jgi:two-component system, chemotaxis family, protein-glutamate methylesterase/glutaminase